MGVTSRLAPPVAFGLPPKFSVWRKGQYGMATLPIDSMKRFIGMAAPTGSGKSAAYVTSSLLSGGRVAVLTSTKGLQSQLVSDFGTIGMSDIRGQNAYLCVAASSFGDPDYTTCNDGACHSGAGCSLRDSGCLYYDAYRAALNAQLVVTNYSYWFHIHEYGPSQGLGKFDMLICDEAHDAPDELSGFMAVELDRKLVKRILHLDVPKADSKQSHWSDWANSGSWAAEKMEMELEKAMKIQLLPTRNLRHEMKEIKKLKQKLITLACMEGEWVSEGSEDGEKVTIAPVECRGYAERFLFRDIPKIVLVSATMRPKTAELLGIDSEQLEFAEYPSTFPIRNRPVYIVPGARMNHKMDESNLRWWLSRIDNIIDKRLDRKGIIHTVSYKRAKYILTHSRHRHIMMTHHTRDVREAIQEFKDSSSPRILVSPSIVTGYDFPFSSAEYGIIAKVPFPDTRGEVMKARTKADKDYAYYIAVQTMVQAAGRIVRAEEDRGESFIVDDTVNAVWFRPKMKLFSPRWFLEAVQSVNVVPIPPQALEREVADASPQI
jgi:ATP-dependent DNA helicase DinG